MTKLSRAWFLAHGFNELKDGGWVLILEQRGGDSDHIYVNPHQKRLCAQLCPAIIEIYDCDSVQRLKEAIGCIGITLPSKSTK